MTVTVEADRIDEFTERCNRALARMSEPTWNMPEGDPDATAASVAQYVIPETPEQLVAKAREASDLFSEARGIKAELAKEAKRAKAEIETCETHARALLAEVAQGGPVGPVEVHLEYYHAAGRVVVSRADESGEILEVRDMLPEERQAQLPGVDEPAPPARPGRPG